MKQAKILVKLRRISHGRNRENNELYSAAIVSVTFAWAALDWSLCSYPLGSTVRIAEQNTTRSVVIAITDEHSDRCIVYNRWLYVDVWGEYLPHLS